MIHQPVSVVSQCGAGAWLYGLAVAEEAVAHLRHVRDDAICKSTTTLLYVQFVLKRRKIGRIKRYYKASFGC